MSLHRNAKYDSYSRWEEILTHTDKHAILVWMTCIFNNWDDVCAFLGDVQQIATTAM